MARYRIFLSLIFLLNKNHHCVEKAFVHFKHFKLCNIYLLRFHQGKPSNIHVSFSTVNKAVYGNADLYLLNSTKKETQYIS